VKIPDERFNAARIPTSPADIPLAYPADTHHIVVVRNNRYFMVDTKGRGKAELAEAFKEVKRMADGTAGEGLGVLCADDRDVWAEVCHSHLSSGAVTEEAADDSSDEL
jgi:carnitine O-acetyltransferase